MKKLNIFNSPFSHASSSTLYKKSKHIVWENNVKSNSISFYVDYLSIMEGVKSKNDGKKKFLWHLESPILNYDFIEKIKNNLDDVLDTYELIFTYSDELLSLHDKFVFTPANGHWIEDIKVHKKTKLLSMISSSKRMSNLQKFRVDFAKENINKMDLYGDLGTIIPSKEVGLNDYMFSVCIENCEHDTYFTEKILDCFATGTIPIYKGTKKITNHFNGDGIIFLEDVDIDNLSSEIYNSKKDAVLENFDKVQNYNVLEDYIYSNHLSKYF